MDSPAYRGNSTAKEGETVIAIGVDPGRSTGFAVWDCQERCFDEIMTYDWWTAYHEGIGWWARARMEDRKLLIRTEDPGGNKPTFGRRGLSKKALDRKAQNVGMNKQQALLLIEGWRRAGILVQTITPQSSKWTQKMFKNISKWPHKTNEHQRDAGRMVVGMRAMPDSQYQRLLKRQ